MTTASPSTTTTETDISASGLDHEAGQPPKRPQPSPRAVVWFIAALVCVIVGFETLAYRIGPGATTRTVTEQHRQNLSNTPPHLSVVFAGDSSAGAAFDSDLAAELIDGSAYTVWLPDASSSVATALFEEFTLANNSTDVVILGLTPRMFNRSTVIRREQLLSNTRDSLPWRSRTDPTTWTTIEQAFADRSALVRYRPGLRQPTDWLLAFRNDMRLVLESDGQPTFFADKDLSDIRDGYQAGERAALAAYEVSDRELETLFDLVDRLKNRSIEVRVALLPTHGPTYDGLFPNPSDSTAAYDRLRRELGARSIETLDLSDLGQDADLFADGNHLNSSGASVATERAVSGLEPGEGFGVVGGPTIRRLTPDNEPSNQSEES